MCMDSQVVFKRDFNLDRIQWCQPIQRLRNNFILEELFHQMIYGTGNRPKTAFLAAMDVIRHSPPKMIAVYLQKGGLVGFRSLTERIHGLNRGWEMLGWALEIFQSLVSAGREVRRILLKHWTPVLRPVKILFERLNHLQRAKRRASEKINLNLYRSRAQSIIADGRNYPRSDPCLFSEYLRSLESAIKSSPDYNEEELNEVFMANKRLHPLHKTILETGEALLRFRRNDILDSLGLDYHSLKPSELPSTPNQHSMVIKDYFQLESESEDGEESGIQSSPIIESHTSGNSATLRCDFHAMKEITLDSSKSEQEEEQPVPEFCDQTGEIFNLQTLGELPKMGPSLVELVNRNPIFCPTIRQKIDSSGSLEDLAFKIAEKEGQRRKSTRIILPTEGSKSRKSRTGSERLIPRPRISAFTSVYGMETAGIRSILTEKTEKPSFLDDQVTFPSVVSDTTTPSITSEKPLESFDSLPQLKSRDSLEDMLCCSATYRRSKVHRPSSLSVDEVARRTVKKALSVVVDKPFLDIEQEISELCRKFRERHEQCVDSVDELAEIIVDTVMLRLKQYLCKESRSRYSESDLKQLIAKALREEEEDYQIRMSERGSLGRILSFYSGRLPVLTMRKHVDSQIDKHESGTDDQCKACCQFRGLSLDPSRPPRIDSKRKSDTEIPKQDSPIRPCSEEVTASSGTIEVTSVKDREESRASSVLPPLKGAPKTPSLMSRENEPSFGSQRGTFKLSESSSEREYTFRHHEPSYELMDSVFTKMAEQLNKQLEQLSDEENTKETDDVNKRALYVLQRVVSNLAVQMSTSAGRFRRQSSQSLESKARRIVSEVLSNPDILNQIRQSDLSLKQSADALVEEVLRSVYSEVSKSLSQDEESNQNASALGIDTEANQNNESEENEVIPIVWRPRGMSLHRAIRTGRLLC